MARGIRGSLGRFCAIMGIVALGCGFFAGLQMCGPNMRAAADALYDGTGLYDIRVMSSLGFTDKDVERVRAIGGVQTVMPSVTCDVMARMGPEQLAVRMGLLNVEAARASEEENAFVITSDGAAYVNRVFLREGTWPQRADECAVTADVDVAGVRVGDTLEVLYGTTDLDDMLRKRTFTVVGMVSASDYPYTGSFGSTTLGSGTIDEYAYVSPRAFVKDAPYTELYLCVDGAEGFESGSDEYEAAVDEVRERLEGQEKDIAQARLRDVRADAQEELDDARDEYQKEKRKADRELAKAKAELDDAKKELDDARDELKEAEAKLADGEAELRDGERAYEEGADRLASSRQELEEAEQTLDDSYEQILASRAELEDGETQWRIGKQELMAKLGLDAGTSLEDARAYVQGLVEMQSRQQQASTQDSRQLEQVLAGIDQLEQTRATLDEGASELEAGEEEYAAGLAKYEDGVDQYNEGQKALVESESQLEGARAELAKGRKEYEDGQAEYEEGLAEYEDGLAKYQKERKKAKKELTDAKKKLDDAQADIDELKEPDIYVLDRSQHEGVMAHNSDSHRMDSIADVFPFMFFLVAALVSLTTMTRMVDDDRIEIGTYKALGYSTARIASKYLLYAGAASVVGAVAGVALLCQVLPYIVMSSYGIIYTVPLQPPPFPVDVSVVALSGGLGVGVTLVATWAAVVASLRETPATLMLPRAPASGKRILLERIGPVWRRLSFSWKVTCRNMFRYKRRLTMTVIGISGCAALLLTGFGLHDAIWDIIDRQYGPISHFDTTVVLDSDAKERDVREVIDYLEKTGEVQNVVRFHTQNMQAGLSADDTMAVRACVPRSVDEIGRVVSLRERLTKAPIAFDDDAVVVTEKLCSMYGLAVGDTIVLFDQDDIGNATGDGHELRITGVAENYVGHSVFVGRDA
jgi:putative ABC transport system permease protein